MPSPIEQSRATATPDESDESKNRAISHGESHRGTALMLCRNTPVYVITNNEAAIPRGKATVFARRNAFGKANSLGAEHVATHNSSAVSE